MKKFFLFFAALLLFVPARAQELFIKVVYPETLQVIGPVDSNFIFGSVTPGAKLSINGTPVEVYKNGAFLAFLPLGEGPFVYRLEAAKNGKKAVLDWPVLVSPKPRPIPPDSLAIRHGSASPSDSIFGYPGELINVSFSGTPGLQAFFGVEGMEDYFPMTETAPPPRRTDTLSAGNPVLGAGMLPESTRTGFYTGVLRLPDKKLERAKIRVYLIKSDSGKKYPEVVSYLSPPAVGAAMASYGAVETLRASVTVWNPAVLRVVELDDSVSVLRSAPNAGYVAIFQPRGVRALLTGRIGRYVKLKLAETQSAWAPDTLVTELPPGTPAPGGFVSYIRTYDAGKWVKIVFTLGRKLAFRVEEDPLLPRLSLFIFGAQSRAEWIRYDNAADFIKNIRWTQAESDIFRADVDLNAGALWGYDVFYEENNLVLMVKKPPARSGSLWGLTVVVDAGHTNHPAETGARGPSGLEERQANLAIALELAKILKGRGVNVVMTRKGTEAVPLYARTEIAKAAGADLFVSIHNNAHPDGVNPFVNNGTSVYYYHVHSQELARAAQRRLLKATGLPDLGLYFGNFAVIRPPQYPAILCEIAFMMIPKQEEMLRSKSFHKKTAQAIAGGISDYLKASTKK
jgi:N-acetylmuramoyl-L-alanine amidase